MPASPSETPARDLLVMGGLRAELRARSLRRFCGHVLDALPPGATSGHLEALRDSWASGRPPSDDVEAQRLLVAEDLARILDAAPLGEPPLPLAEALEPLVAALRDAGVDMDAPALHLRAGLPPSYDVPFLRAVSLDASDAAHSGLPAGIHVDAARRVPLVTTCALGHVLVHSALGSRSPERLGRGLEEGLSEVLGALHAAGAVLGPAAADAVFDALRRTPAPGPHREAFLGHVRAASLVHRRHGLAGLARLVNEGRDGIARAEAVLLAGRPEDLALPRAEPDPHLAARLDRLLLSRGAPLLVRPLAFWLLPYLARERHVDRAADAAGVPREPARMACRDLVDRAFVLLLGRDGELLVDALDAVIPHGLRYDLPIPPGRTVP